MVSLCLLWLASTSSDYLQEQRERVYGQSMARQIAVAVAEPLQRGDLLSARASLQRFIDDSLAGGVSIRDVEGMPIGTAGAPVFEDSREYLADIRIGDDIAGEVAVSIDATIAEEFRWRFILSLLALAAALSLLVFMAARSLAMGLATHLIALRSQLDLTPSTDAHSAKNEITQLHRSVEQLPLEMLRAHAQAPAAATQLDQGTILYVHLVSLTRYVDALNETNLHRYTRRLQQILRAAAQCYRGEVSVCRSFGLLITFRAQPNAGSETLRAASCARLIVLVIDGLKNRTRLSLQMSMAMGQCEQVADDEEDIYPRLYSEGAVDELQEVCRNSKDDNPIYITQDLLGDEPLAESAELLVATSPDAEGFVQLATLSTEQEKLLQHQAQLIVERISPDQG